MCYANVTSNWTFDPTTGTGSFEWALTRLKQGHKVRRKSWEDSNAHLYIRSDEQKYEIRLNSKNSVGIDSAWHPYESGILATDWEIYVKRCDSCGQKTT